MLLFYLGLGLSLIVLIKFCQKTISLAIYGPISTSSDVITNILSLIDLSLIVNLLLIVMFTGYENFVSSFDLDNRVGQTGWGRLILVTSRPSS